MDDLNKVLADAFASPIARERGIGCGRVYVVISDKAQAKLVEKAAKKLDKIFQKKAHYGMTNALYIGYDNCDGAALARGTAVVKALKEAGINCYRDEHGD